MVANNEALKSDIEAVMDYVSRLQPPEELRAPEDWRNPDFLEVASEP